MNSVLSLPMNWDTCSYIKKANAIFMDTRTQFNTDKFELEANTFAIDLLLPDSLLEEYKEFTIEQISRITGYHQRLIELRLST